MDSAAWNNPPQSLRRRGGQAHVIFGGCPGALGEPGDYRMDLAAARACFPGTRDRAFLDAACISLMPVQADEALRRLSQDLLHCPARDASAHHIALDQTAEQPRREIARLINCRPEDVALVESTTQPLEPIPACIPLGPGASYLS